MSDETFSSFFRSRMERFVETFNSDTVHSQAEDSYHTVGIMDVINEPVSTTSDEYEEVADTALIIGDGEGDNSIGHHITIPNTESAELLDGDWTGLFFKLAVIIDAPTESDHNIRTTIEVPPGTIEENTVNSIDVEERDPFGASELLEVSDWSHAAHVVGDPSTLGVYQKSSVDGEEVTIEKAVVYIAVKV